MNRFGYLFSLIFLVAFYCEAQDIQKNSAEIMLALQKLNVTGSVLYIAAHPDDENTRLLAYLAKERKLRTGYLSMTRGDGGQNLIGTEQAELLGLIRTQELLAARKIDGAEQFFTRANDFGFSKTSEESLRFWGKEQILADVVWVIRRFKPDVIITRFPEDARAGHGQHSSSAILAREAFSAAADPQRFPEQLNMVKPWQAKRIVWNTSNFSGNNSTSNDQLKINVGLYNPLLGKSYGEIAAQSRTNHKSQGFGSAGQRGDFIEYFSHVGGAQAKTDLFEDVDISWNRIPNGERISASIDKAVNDFDLKDPSKSVEQLLALRPLIVKSGNTVKLAELNDLILSCAGIWFEANSIEAQAALGDAVPIRLQAIARVPQNFKYKIAISEVLSQQKDLVLEPNKPISINTSLRFPAQQLSQPYWLEAGHNMGAYTINKQQNVGMPENKTPFSAQFLVKIGNEIIEVQRPVDYKFTDQVRGEIYQPLVVAPPVTATLPSKAYIFTGNEPKDIEVELQSFRDNCSGTLKPHIPKGWKISPENSAFSFSRKGETQTLTFKITPGAASEAGDLIINAEVGGQVFNQGIKKIVYDHIPAQTLFPASVAHLEKLDLKLAGKKLAYIPGAGDLVAEALQRIGYDVTTLSDEQVLNADLAVFDAVITGVRLYNVNRGVRSIQPKLLDYVQKGGVLLVQYNVNNPLQIQNLGPYPFTLSRDRVTDEEAKATIINPEQRILNYPNKISSKDFEGWVQERGLYFASQVDKAYVPVLSFNDKGESPNTGSLLVADYGKGRFVYTSLAFFRQLPAGVPGAYRLFVNLISK